MDVQKVATRDIRRLRSLPPRDFKFIRSYEFAQRIVARYASFLLRRDFPRLVLAFLPDATAQGVPEASPSAFGPRAIYQFISRFFRLELVAGLPSSEEGASPSAATRSARSRTNAVEGRLRRLAAHLESADAAPASGVLPLLRQAAFNRARLEAAGYGQRFPNHPAAIDNFGVLQNTGEPLPIARPASDPSISSDALRVRDILEPRPERLAPAQLERKPLSQMPALTQPAADFAPSATLSGGPSPSGFRAANAPVRTGGDKNATTGASLAHDQPDQRPGQRRSDPSLIYAGRHSDPLKSSQSPKHSGPAKSEKNSGDRVARNSPAAPPRPESRTGKSTDRGAPISAESRAVSLKHVNDADLHAFTNRVYALLRRKITIEQERRGAR